MFDPDTVLQLYNRAIHKTANTYYKDSSRFSYGDLVAEAQTAAIEACNSYDPKNRTQTTFFTYLTTAMHNEVRKFVSANSLDIRVPETRQREEYKREGHTDKLKEEFNAEHLDILKGDSQHGPHDVLPSGDVSPDIAMIRAESLGILKEEMNNLPDRERVVLNARWMEGKTLEQIAGGFGVTKQTIHGWEKKGFERLRKRVKHRLGDELVF